MNDIAVIVFILCCIIAGIAIHKLIDVKRK